MWSHDFVAPCPPFCSRERKFRGSTPGAAVLHPVWHGFALSQSWSSFLSPAKQGLSMGLQNDFMLQYLYLRKTGEAETAINIPQIGPIYSPFLHHAIDNLTLKLS